jgi:hypothetical protein
VCDGEVIVVRAPGGDVIVECGGYPMIPLAAATDQRSGGLLSPRPGHDGGMLLGKRYRSAESDLELLCTRAGVGSLSVSAADLVVAPPTPLPASD